MLDFKENEIASNFDEWKNRVHPQDLKWVYADIAEHIQGESGFYANEHRVQRKDGFYLWALDRGVVVSRDAHGAPTRMVGSHSDISGYS
jgi:PAS domain S-box-containing protein